LGACQPEKPELELARSLCASGSNTDDMVRLVSKRVEKKVTTVWDDPGDNLVQHLAGLDDYAMVVAAYWAAVQSRPKDKITLRQGANALLFKGPTVFKLPPRE
jgi:hypothetical protein